MVLIAAEIAGGRSSLDGLEASDTGLLAGFSWILWIFYMFTSNAQGFPRTPGTSKAFLEFLGPPGTSQAFVEIPLNSTDFLRMPKNDFDFLGISRKAS